MVDKKARLEIAKSIFEGILDANLHQGEKASRLLIIYVLGYPRDFSLQFFFGE